MKYWDDMQSKLGFSDGEAMPGGVEKYREVYVKAVNQIAAVLGSKGKAVEFDRNGDHNWCLILFEPEELDEEMERAIALAHVMDLDGYVEVQVTVRTEELEDLLTNHMSDTELQNLAEEFSI